MSYFQECQQWCDGITHFDLCMQNIHGQVGYDKTVYPSIFVQNNNCGFTLYAVSEAMPNVSTFFGSNEVSCRYDL